MARGSRPDSRVRRGGAGGCRGATPCDGGCDRGDVVGSGAAAAAREVQEAGAGELAHGGRHRLGREVVAPEFVGQAGVGVAADPEFGDGRQLLEVGAKRIGAESAVQTEGQGCGVAERVVERLGGLAGQRSPALVGDRARNHQGEADARGVELLHDREERRLRVERVEDGFDHQDVGASRDEGAGLLAVRAPELLEGCVAGAWVVDVRRDRRGAVHGAQDAGHEAGPAGVRAAYSSAASRAIRAAARLISPTASSTP